MPDTSIIFPGLFPDEPENENEKACTCYSADDASDDPVKADSDKTEKCTCNNASHDSEKDVDDDAVVALHDESCEPSADCTHKK